LTAQVKSVRVPKKANGTPRGFAFVDFATPKEAQSVIATVGDSTHLYGRRLVLHYAEDDESIDTLREKTGRYFEASSGPPAKRQKKVEEDEFFGREGGDEDEM